MIQTEFAVITNNLTKKFGNFTAVNNVSIQVKRGEIFGFLGANGAGKTTMIRMLCGLLKPTTGIGSVEGFDIYNQSEEIKTIIGYMSQKFSLYEDLTIEENIEFYAGIYGLDSTQISHKQDELFTSLKLHKWAKNRTKDLPLGFKQRLALGCAMLHSPKILFLDEPTSGVDPVVRRSFWEVIHNTARTGTTIFVTTHFMDEAEYCNRISIMSAGEVIALGSPQNLKQNYKKDSIHNIFVEIVRNRLAKNNIQIN
jgi:ABC-2 type transport system ATP-binding protein